MEKFTIPGTGAVYNPGIPPPPLMPPPPPPATSFYSSGSGALFEPLSVEAPLINTPEMETALGLQGLIRNTFAPSLSGELERLFVTEAPISQTSRVRLGSSSSGGSDSGDSGLWEDFNGNGRTGDLDDLDRMMRHLDMQAAAGRVAAAAGDPDMSLHDLSPVSGVGTADVEVLSKAKLLEILRIRERERRNRGRKPPSEKNGIVCVFCRNNGESEAIYTSHKLKDAEGRITCPILYIYTCPICGAKGENAHTIKYCPRNDGEGLNIKALKTKRTSCGRRRIWGIGGTSPPSPQ